MRENTGSTSRIDPTWPPCRVLIVEDEALLALDLEAILAKAGCEVVGPAQDYDAALGLAAAAAVDVALLDANLSGQPVDEIAATLARRGIKFAFVSGYGPEGLPEAFRSTTLIPKPFREEQILKSIEALRTDHVIALAERRAG